MIVLIMCQDCATYVEHSFSSERGTFSCNWCGADNALEHSDNESAFDEYLERSLKRRMVKYRILSHFRRWTSARQW